MAGKVDKDNNIQRTLATLSRRDKQLLQPRVCFLHDVTTNRWDNWILQSKATLSLGWWVELYFVDTFP